MFQLEVRVGPGTALRGRHSVQHELSHTSLLLWEPAGSLEGPSSTLVALYYPAPHQPQTTACSRIWWRGTGGVSPAHPAMSTFSSAPLTV